MENKEELELLKMLDEAEEDVKNGRTSSVEEMFDEIRKKLNLLDKTDIQIVNNKSILDGVKTPINECVKVEWK